MKRRKIFISGKVSGLPFSYVKYHFGRASDKYKELGYDVFNPTEHCKVYWSWWRCMIVCLWNLTWCDSVYFLKNWDKSRGAKIEYRWAKFLEKEIIYEEWKWEK